VYQPAGKPDGGTCSDPSTCNPSCISAESTPIAGIRTRTGVDLASGAAAPEEGDAAGRRNRRRRGGSRLAGADGGYGDNGQQGGHPRHHPGTGETGGPWRRRRCGRHRCRRHCCRGRRCGRHRCRRRRPAATTVSARTTSASAHQPTSTRSNDATASTASSANSSRSHDVCRVSGTYRFFVEVLRCSQSSHSGRCTPSAREAVPRRRRRGSRRSASRGQSAGWTSTASRGHLPGDCAVTLRGIHALEVGNRYLHVL
jgi:hypothetical protein